MYQFYDSGQGYMYELPCWGNALIMAESIRTHRLPRYTDTHSFAPMYPHQYLTRTRSLAYGRSHVNPGYDSKVEAYLAVKKITTQLGIEMKDQEFECADCCTVIPDDDIVVYQGDAYCGDCCSQCEHCEELHPDSESVYDGYFRVCQSCYEDSYFTCESCDHICHSDGLCTVSGDTFVCESCVSNGSYNYCEEDGTYHYWDCGCGECGESQDSSYIHNYSYEPDTIFYDDRMGHRRAKRGEFYFGAEIEMNTTRGYETVNECAEYVYNNIGEDLVYLKEDCSIGTGFEFVTHPMDLNYWREHFPWDKYERLASMGMLAWDSVDKKCGLHINISRAAFTNSSHLAKFLLFVYRNEEELVKFAGRRSVNYAHFSSSERERFIDHGKGGTYGDRHVAVNCQNPNRIEFRIFRPSLKRDTIIASVELCHALCHFTNVTTINDIHNKRFDFKSFREWLTAGDTPTTYDRLVARIDKRVYGIAQSETIEQA